MSAEYLDTTLSQIRELIARLQAPVPDKLTLLQLLSAPLDHLGLLPPKFRRYNVSPLPSKQETSWEDCVRNLAAIPAKVANALGGKADVPVELQQGTYFHGLSIRCERLIDTLAADSSREWLAIMAPDALELAVTLGTRPVSVAEGDDDEEPDEARTGEKQNTREKGRGKDAALLTAALELALIVLDGSLELDEGRSLGLEHTALLFGAEEWAKEVFSKLESGVRTLGEGGEHEVRLRRAAAGVLLKVDELTSKWRRSMIDFASL
ncbi:predicted protein [Postia placenta Mad-698-R]|nr:predicted protein [Postia placenta Mad-698-R]